tara:strand:- start:877 stop:1431 length:555 start_codon:yes stop_codon:yes gene_type:complete
MSVKKTFDKNNLPVIETMSSSLSAQRPRDVDVELDANLYHAMEMLEDALEDDTRMEILSGILDIAKEVAETHWERGCEIAKANIHKVSVPFDDDLIMDLMDIAIHDPQIEAMNKVMGITGGYDFKSLGDIAEIQAAIPKEALLLLERAEACAHPQSKILNEVRGLRNAIDPSYTMPEGAGFDLH